MSGVNDFVERAVTDAAGSRTTFLETPRGDMITAGDKEVVVLTPVDAEGQQNLRTILRPGQRVVTTSPFGQVMGAPHGEPAHVELYTHEVSQPLFTVGVNTVRALGAVGLHYGQSWSVLHTPRLMAHCTDSFVQVGAIALAQETASLCATYDCDQRKVDVALDSGGVLSCRTGNASRAVSFAGDMTAILCEDSAVQVRPDHSAVEITLSQLDGASVMTEGPLRSTITPGRDVVVEVPDWVIIVDLQESLVELAGPNGRGVSFATSGNGFLVTLCQHVALQLGGDFTDPDEAGDSEQTMLASLVDHATVQQCCGNELDVTHRDGLAVLTLDDVKIQWGARLIAVSVGADVMIDIPAKRKHEWSWAGMTVGTAYIDILDGEASACCPTGTWALTADREVFTSCCAITRTLSFQGIPEMTVQPAIERESSWCARMWAGGAFIDDSARLRIRIEDDHRVVFAPAARADDTVTITGNRTVRAAAKTGYAVELGPDGQALFRMDDLPDLLVARSGTPTVQTPP